jgi:hypothetical protein
MNEADVLLRMLSEELGEESPEIVGRLELTGEGLSVMDGRANLSVVIRDDPGAHPALVHCHVMTQLGEEHSGLLDACIVGIDQRREEGLRDAARSWKQLVGGPIFSLMHARAVMGAEHFDGSQSVGASGCHGFVGPLGTRMLNKKGLDATASLDAPMFDYAAEIAPPGIVHLAKVTLQADGNGAWNRNLEIDGHLAAHADTPWKRGPAAPADGMATRFAVFHYADQPERIEDRRDLDSSIRRFVAAFQKVDDSDSAAEVLKNAGVEDELVNRVVAFAPLAFAHVIFATLRNSFPDEYILVRRDGTLLEGLQLMQEPAFARAMMLSQELSGSETLEALKKVACTSSLVHAINNAALRGSKPEDLIMTPPVVFYPGASEEVVNKIEQMLAARLKEQFGALRKPKPWWRFW